MSTDNSLSIFKNIRSMSEQNVRLQHHLISLRTYIDQNTVPAGLKIGLKPQLVGTTSNRFNKRWNHILITCSMQLCNLLFDQAAHKSTELATRIKSGKTKLSKSTTADELATFLKRISACEKHLSSKLLITRSRKQKRDGLSTHNVTEVPSLPQRKTPTPRNRRFQRPQPRQPQTSNVVNLSKTTLSESETKLLSKGLNFCPKPTTYNSLELNQDLQAFSRRIRLKDYFADTASNSDVTEAHLRFRKKSKWQPPKSKDPTLEAYIQAVEREVVTHKNISTAPDNLTRTEREALAALKTRSDIIIKPADKGSAVVVMDTSDYIAEANRQLLDTRYYKELDHDPTAKHTEIVTKLLSEMHDLGHIDDKAFEYLLPEKPTPGRFYLLPKIHKPGCPGRPIISANSHPTEKISEFIDFHLRPLVENLPSYIKDTTDFLRKIQTLNIPPDACLVTMDVTSLYTNIPHDEGIKACKKALDTRTDKTVPTKYLVKMIELVLTLNNFEFNGKHFLQTNGTAMGTKMAPSYANIFMGDLEESMLSEAPYAPELWLRFIDDIFTLPDNAENTLAEFLSFCNDFHPSIKFTAEHSKEKVTFLDTTTHVQEDKIITDLYTKPTDTHQYLLPSSCHPPHCTKSIPYSLAIRLRRICSSEDTFQSQCKALEQHLVDRDYPRKTLQEPINKARNTTRESALQYKPPKINSRLPLVVTYHPDLPNLSEITRRLWNFMLTSERHRNLFPEPPLISFRKPRSIRDHLVRAKLGKTEQDSTTGCKPCYDPRCQTCKTLTECNSFHGSVTDRRFKIFCSTNCKTANAIYLIECTTCQIQYVGETKNPVHKRMNQHRVSAKDSNTVFPVGIHFSSDNHGWQNMKLTIIDSDYSWTDRKRKERESFWISKLCTLKPDGLNLDPGIITW